MSQDLRSEYLPLLEAVSFAARAHGGQLRKDGETPYAAHVFRVCLVLARVFGVTDRRVLTAAVLHDTVEDTTTDFDDIEEKWDAEIGAWVAALSKDKRLAYEERETDYCRILTGAPWQVQVCKLADLFDNILDTAFLPAAKQLTDLRKKKRYLDALRAGLKSEAASAFETVVRLYEQTEAALAG